MPPQWKAAAKKAAAKKKKDKARNAKRLRIHPKEKHRIAMAT